MPKNSNNQPKPVKGTQTMNGAMKLFLAGLVAELYLLAIRRFYVTGTAVQMIAWFDYLLYFAAAGGVIFLVGAALGLAWRKDRKKRTPAWYVAGAGAFLGIASGLIRLFNAPAVSLLTVVVFVVMLLGILWQLYDRECAYALTILGLSLVVLWVCRREMASMYLGTYVRVIAVVYILLLAVVALLARRADRKNGMLGSVQVLPETADILPVYVACGLSAVAMVIALISATAAYYAMWGLGLVVFALAVYYTVKQL
ncbi:hypothetical protein [uncultured Oscillibacter sp.]|uniref:hypothetical protein n=1 Tax=uncultured Oscillibacter sp. TaxID=876091 RepID=UPI0025F807D5|nr:hypothetical protein [uncultured Oscillibacter sp.]